MRAPACLPGLFHQTDHSPACPAPPSTRKQREEAPALYDEAGVRERAASPRYATCFEQPRQRAQRRKLARSDKQAPGYFTARADRSTTLYGRCGRSSLAPGCSNRSPLV
jgi:hypothetical protein